MSGDESRRACVFRTRRRSRGVTPRLMSHPFVARGRRVDNLARGDAGRNQALIQHTRVLQLASSSVSRGWPSRAPVRSAASHAAAPSLDSLGRFVHGARCVARHARRWTRRAATLAATARGVANASPRRAARPRRRPRRTPPRAAPRRTPPRARPPRPRRSRPRRACARARPSTSRRPRSSCSSRANGDASDGTGTRGTFSSRSRPPRASPRGSSASRPRERPRRSFAWATAHRRETSTEAEEGGEAAETNARTIPRRIPRNARTSPPRRRRRHTRRTSRTSRDAFARWRRR